MNETLRSNVQVNRLLMLHAQTSLHPGSGTALGAVDLPVQRECHTQWPVISGSALKGVLRDMYRQKLGGDNDDLFAVFGPETKDADKHAGAVSFTDARLLAYPVRSLCGVFAWVTCPAVLERLDRDLALAGEPRLGALPRFRAGAMAQAACDPNSPLLVEGRLVLEEFDFTRDAGIDVSGVIQWIAENATADAGTRTRLTSHLAVLGDDDFTHFVRHATEIVARIHLDYHSKTVKSGALFYQEFLPAETLFYSLVFANASRRDGTKDAKAIAKYLKDNLPPVLQIGGDETIGKGLCMVRFAGKE